MLIVQPSQPLLQLELSLFKERHKAMSVQHGQQLQNGQVLGCARLIAEQLQELPGIYGFEAQAIFLPDEQLVKPGYADFQRCPVSNATLSVFLPKVGLLKVTELAISAGCTSQLRKDFRQVCIQFRVGVQGWSPSRISYRSRKHMEQQMQSNELTWHAAGAAGQRTLFVGFSSTWGGLLVDADVCRAKLIWA